MQDIMPEGNPCGTTIGIDLAKEVFAVCALDTTGAVVYSKVLKRDAFIAWDELFPTC